jgi:hypothetical protein
MRRTLHQMFLRRNGHVHIHDTMPHFLRELKLELRDEENIGPPSAASMARTGIGIWFAPASR